MSEITILLGREFIDEVMEQVDISQESSKLSHTSLQSLKSGRVVAAAGQAWDKLQTLLNDIAGRGWEAIQSALKEFEIYLEDLANKLDDEAQNFRELLRDKIREVVDKLAEKALHCVRSRVLIGGDVYALTSFTLQSKFAYTTSMEVSLTALCRFIAAGEIVTTGTYSLMQPQLR